MTKETKKIMEDDSIAVSAKHVCVFQSCQHSESVYIETQRVAPIEEIKAKLASFHQVLLEDDVEFIKSILAINAVFSRVTFVGRIRKDLDAEKGIHMCEVSDNLLKGAAWRTQFKAETLFENVDWFVQQLN